MRTSLVLMPFYKFYRYGAHDLVASAINLHLRFRPLSAVF
jgi:hypothetical protein